MAGRPGDGPGFHPSPGIHGVPSPTGGMEEVDPVIVEVREGTEEVDPVIVEVRGGTEEVDQIGRAHV